MSKASKAFQNAVVLYDNESNFIQKRMAFKISRAISEKTKMETTFARKPLDPDAAQIVLKDNKRLKNGKFKITIANNTATLEAGSYYGYTGILNFLGTKKAADFYAFKDGFNVTGDFRDYLPELWDSDRFVYDRRGTLRVMFSNVLFGESGFGNILPNRDRTPLQQEMIRQYLPDVVGYQEFNNSKREGACDINGVNTPKFALPTLLAKLGYVEVVDPKVHNTGLYGTTFTVHSDALGDVTYHPFDYKERPDNTYLNNTPLFYNSKTTKCLVGEYYWYRNHWDGKEAQARDNPSPMQGVGDWGSKSATWGLFEDIKTGDRYVVISTHMCTRSNYMRALEAIEMVDLIEALTKKYNVPIILGGDMNGTSNGYNVQIFQGKMAPETVETLTSMIDEEVSFNFRDEIKGTLTPYKEYSKLKDYANRVAFDDLQTAGSAKEYTSPVRTHHTYPNYNYSAGLMMPGHRDNTGFSTDCIDHIFLANSAKLEAENFCVVVDECTMSSSDHYPVFSDFKFIK